MSLKEFLEKKDQELQRKTKTDTPGTSKESTHQELSSLCSIPCRFRDWSLYPPSEPIVDLSVLSCERNVFDKMEPVTHKKYTKKGNIHRNN